MAQVTHWWCVASPLTRLAPLNITPGGFVTEAGARWFQSQSDFGNPLTVIDWLTKLRANPDAPFFPGVMIDWEVMVFLSNSNTRWSWANSVS